MDCLSTQNSLLIGPKNPAKFENDCISRSVHRFKITQPNLTILVSFSSAEDVVSNDVKKYEIFGLQGTENPPFRFFWDTRYKHHAPTLLFLTFYSGNNTCDAIIRLVNKDSYHVSCSILILNILFIVHM